MITLRNVELAPRRVRHQLADLTEAWPVGALVRHEAGWTGTVTLDEGASPGWPYDVTGDPDAHALTPSGVPIVCVTGSWNGQPPVTAWYVTRVLRRVTAPSSLRPAGSARPAPRGRRRTRGGRS